MKSYSTKACIMILFLVSMFTVSIAQTDWEKYDGNPVLRPGSPGSWEDYEVYGPCVLKHGDTLKMWYTGSKIFDVDHIGYAISSDGINWQKETSNPVLQVGASGNWDSEIVSHPRIILVDTTYHMWYTGTDDLSSYRVGYATSSDGINWTKYPENPVISLGDPGEWDSATNVGHSYFFDGDSFHVWYAGSDNTHTSIGYAKSSDGINWVKYPDNPVFYGSGSWDSVAVIMPSVIVDSTGYKMWYQGHDGLDNARIGYATSSDGINWDWEALDSFVLEAGNPGTWDDLYVSRPQVLLDDTTYRMWYSGGRSNTGNQIGYATSSDGLGGILEESGSGLPGKFVLMQNYPNPFNPITNIEYRIPKSELVSLKVYDVLGREVQILVNENQRAGNHSIQFDVGQLASGVYFYILQAGNEFTETKKMLLMR